MKTKAILLLFLIAGLFHSCKKKPDVPLGNFKNIIVSGNVNATLVDGSSNALASTSGITVATAVVGNDLIVTGSGSATISISSVDTIFFNGAATLSCARVLNANRLVIECNGSNNAKMDNMNIKDTLVVLVNGTGTYTFSGLANNLRVNANGTGSFSGYGLTSTNCAVNVTSTGHSYVFVTTSLSGVVSGNGNVYYKGNPFFVFPVYNGQGRFIKQ